MTFVLRFRKPKSLFWSKRTVAGFKLEREIDRMILYFENGSIEEIPAWSSYHSKLGQDWVLALKKQMESQAGTSVPLAVKTGD